MTPLPTPLPPPPRRVMGLIAGSPGAWFGRIFVMPHTLVGIGAAGYWIFLLLWTLFGADLPAFPTGTDTSYSSKHGTTYLVRYKYQVNGEIKTGSGSVSQVEYNRFKGHDDPAPELTVRYFSLGPLNHAELAGRGNRWAPVGFLTLWVAFWNSIVGVFVYALWIKPLRVRSLYKHGLATPGILTNKRTRTGKSTTYYVSYVFKDPTTGNTITREIDVWNPAAWQMMHIGRPVTVLYAPKNPKLSTVYECGGYSVPRSVRLLIEQDSGRMLNRDYSAIS